MAAQGFVHRHTVRFQMIVGRVVCAVVGSADGTALSGIILLNRQLSRQSKIVRPIEAHDSLNSECEQTIAAACIGKPPFFVKLVQQLVGIRT